MIEFLSGETRPIQRELERRMQEAAAEERFEDAARYRNRLFAIRHLAERQAADRRSVGTVDVIGIAAEGDRGGGADLPAPRRQARRPLRVPPRERRAARTPPTVLEAFCLEYYGSAPSVPPQIVVPPDVGRHGRARGVPVRAARLAGRGARAGARREAPPPGARRPERACSRSSRTLLQSEQRRLRRVEALEELRETLNLESLPLRIECYDISNIQARVAGRLDGRLPGRGAEEGALPQVRRPPAGRAGRLRGDGGGRLAALRAPVGDATADEYDESFAAMPNLVVIDGGKGQLVGRARRDAGVRPAARGGDLAREARGGGLRARAAPIRSCSAATRRGSSCSSGSATRRTASRSASTASAADAQGPRLDLRRAAGRRARRGAARCSGHFGSAERLLEATQEELEGVPGVPAKTARAVYAQLHKAGRA